MKLVKIRDCRASFISTFNGYCTPQSKKSLLQNKNAQFTISLNKSTTAPVGWLPLQAYPGTYF